MWCWLIVVTTVDSPTGLREEGLETVTSTGQGYHMKGHVKSQVVSCEVFGKGLCCAIKGVSEGGGPGCGGGWVDPMGIFIQVCIEKVFGGRLAAGAEECGLCLKIRDPGIET
jgi:hypothetical protein